MRRWPVIRHIRYLLYAVQLARWVDYWRPWGYGHASDADLAYLDAVWAGKA